MIILVVVFNFLIVGEFNITLITKTVLKPAYFLELTMSKNIWKYLKFSINLFLFPLCIAGNIYVNTAELV